MGLKTRITKFAVWRLTSGVVASGPFKGLRYTPGVVGSALAPKLVGTYEKELHSVIAQIIARSPRAVLNVGAAEGYFAAGLARAIPSVRVIAFEAESRGQELVRRLAALNGVAERVHVEGYCDLHAFQAALQAAGPATVLMDIEGGERELLDPTKVPELNACSVLVEVHEARHPGLEKLLLDRFSKTHKATAFAQADRRVGDFPLPLPFWLQLLGIRFVLRAMNEKRGNRVSWLFLEPLN